MNRRYLPVGLIVTIIGIAFIFLPQTIEMHIAPELVTVWETSTTTNGGYSFNTGDQEIGDVMAPHVKVWTEEDVSLNTTFRISGEEWSDFTVTSLDNPAEFMIPGKGTVNVIIEGENLGGTNTEIKTGLYYLNPMEPENITYYPYRSFGYGMLAIGIIASAIFYTRGEKHIGP